MDRITRQSRFPWTGEILLTCLERNLSKLNSSMSSFGCTTRKSTWSVFKIQKFLDKVIIFWGAFKFNLKWLLCFVSATRGDPNGSVRCPLCFSFTIHKHLCFTSINYFCIYTKNREIFSLSRAWKRRRVERNKPGRVGKDTFCLQSKWPFWTWSHREGSWSPPSVPGGLLHA